MSSSSRTSEDEVQGPDERSLREARRRIRFCSSCSTVRCRTSGRVPTEDTLLAASDFNFAQ